MKKLFGFLLRLAVFLALALWLADRPGTARIVWHDYVIQCSATFLGLTILAVSIAFYLVYCLVHVLINGPELRRLKRKLKNLEQGHDFLTQGLIAVAGGHAIEAGRLAVNARKKLGATTPTLLLQAQAAQLAHDHRSARALFRTMIEDAESAVLGYRGLITEARRAGDWDEVERLCAELGNLKPDVPWLDLMRFEVATRRQMWEQAGKALTRLASLRLLAPETAQRHRAALLITQSQEEARQGNNRAALESAEQAVKHAPVWLPTLINLAQQQAAGHYMRAVRSTVEKGWALQPHPQLAATLRSSDKDPLDIYKQTQRLCRDHEDDPISHLVLAEAALAADIWGEARRHLMMLVAHDQATQAAYRLLARLERRESGDERAVSQWLTKAAEATPDPAWLCAACGSAHTDWQATCRSCSAFASLEWRSPGVGHAGERVLTPLLSDWSNDV